MSLASHCFLFISQVLAAFFLVHSVIHLCLVTHFFPTNCFERMAEFYCAPCKVQMNSRSQWEYHEGGVKHKRAVTVSTSEVDISAASIHEIVWNMYWHQYNRLYFFHVVVLPDGTFKCKSCDDFVCSGRIPFEQHLVGQRHLKNSKAVSVISPSEVDISASIKEIVISLKIRIK